MIHHSDTMYPTGPRAEGPLHARYLRVAAGEAIIPTRGRGWAVVGTIPTEDHEPGYAPRVVTPAEVEAGVIWHGRQRPLFVRAWTPLTFGGPSTLATAEISEVPRG